MSAPALQRGGRAGRARPAVALLLLAMAVVVVCSATLGLGRLGIPPSRQPQALAELVQGRGPFVLRSLRGPRLATALGAGGCLGLAGALFQRASANPLVTPDVIGITAAAGAGTALATSLGLPPGPGALCGALLAGAVVATVTGTGLRNPGPVIVAGIGVAAASTSLTQLVLVRAGQAEAMALASALTGSLTARSWADAALVWAVLVPGIALAVLMGRDLALVELGDDAAHALGVRPGALRTCAMLLGIGCTAAAVAAAGPVTFVALTAPHLARGATGRAGLAPAALVGALVVAASDLAVQQVAALHDLPVGVVTAVLGGIFLGVLLVSELRRGAL